jgi:probable phosphoglycerate mutase
VPTTTFFLVRHAAHDRLDRVLCGRMPGVALGETGLAQAERVAERLAGQGIDALYTSPLERARMTAEPIARRLGREARVLEALNELEFGEWSGRDFSALQDDPRWAAWNTARHLARPPGGETMLEAQTRVLGGLERLRAEYGEGRVALVSHADVIKAVLAFCLGIPLDGLQRFDVEPASVSTVVMGEWGAKVLAMNVVPAP